jgi:hypothetical protein
MLLPEPIALSPLALPPEQTNFSIFLFTPFSFLSHSKAQPDAFMGHHFPLDS